MASIPLPALAVQQQPGPLEQYGKALSIQALLNQQKTTQLQQTGLEQENQQRALALQDQNTLRGLSSKHVQKDSNGNVTGFDFDGLIKDAGAAGVNPALLNQMQNQRAEAIKNLAGADEATRNNEQARNKTLYETLESIRSVKDLPGRQAALQQAMPSLAKQGIKIPPNSPLDDASLDHFEAGLGMHAQVLADAKTASETAEKTQAAATAKANQEHLEMETAQGGPPATRELNDWLAKNPGKGASDYTAWKAGQEATARSGADLALLDKLNKNSQAGGRTTAPGMTPEATDSAATSFHNTGQLPAIGRGSVGVAQRTAIMNREREMFPGTVLSADSAEFKANAESLKKLQSNFDQVSAFESTAIKNLDQVIETGKAIPDLGARFANVPVRNITADMIGTPAMAKFRTALLTAQTESAKVLASANANGVLSDSARHEAQEILDGNLPYPAMVASANQLKTDFGNRHQSYADQLTAIKGRMGGKNAPESTPSKTLTQAQVQQAAKDHNVSVEEATRQAKAAGYTVQ
jgi:hypothetical protein